MPYDCFRDHNCIEAFPSRSLAEVCFPQMLDESHMVKASHIVKRSLPDHESIRNIIRQVTVRRAVGLFNRTLGETCYQVPTYTTPPNLFGGAQLIHYRSRDASVRIVGDCFDKFAYCVTMHDVIVSH